MKKTKAPPAERHTEQMNFRLTPSQRQKLERHAADKDWPVSKFVRKIVEKAMEEMK